MCSLMSGRTGVLGVEHCLCGLRSLIEVVGTFLINIARDEGEESKGQWLQRRGRPLGI